MCSNLICSFSSSFLQSRSATDMRTLTSATTFPTHPPPFLCNNKNTSTLRRTSSVAGLKFPLRVQSTSSPMAATDSDERLAEIHKFESTKRGVKGLVDEGITSLPPIFVHPPGFLADTGPGLPDSGIPTVDLSGGSREEIAAEVARACREVGFFQVVNHGVPLEVLERTVGAVKGFHEMDAEEKARFYGREMGTGVSFISNVDLFRSKAASWRDTLQVRLGPTFPNPEDIPEICRNEVSEWNQHSTRVAELLMELMCEGLGVATGRLKEMACAERRMMVGHYYPSCPQPDLTVGISCHTDPGVLTIVLQDQVGGLQVKLGGKWVDVKPVPGALVINVGDILQMMSNDEFKSIEHRVLANPTSEPRISVGVFYNSSHLDGIFGPLPELVSPDKPARYKQVSLMEYLKTFFARELGDKSVKDHFKL